MLAALENMTPPVEQGLDRARTVVEEGLKVHPDSLELVQALYRVLALAGDKDAALHAVEAKAKDDPNGTVRRLLVDIHRDEKRYEAAQQIVRELLDEQPKDQMLAGVLVDLTAARATEAAQKGDTEAERALNDEAGGLIQKFRDQFPEDIRFPRAECELAARTGELDRALAVSREIDEMDASSPIGPTLRAQIASVRGWSEGVAKEYAEAVKRAPKRDDLRLSLAEAELALGHGDEALQQANILIEHNAASASALVLKARALSQTRGPAGQIKAGRDEAVHLLTNALQNQPTFAAAYHLIAEIEMMNGNRAAALDSLRRGLKAVPNDSAGLAQLVQILAQPGPDGNPPTPDDLSEATAWADRLAEPDVSGELALSVSIGFHRAGQIDQALPWAEKAVERQGSWVAHLNYADLLLGRGRVPRRFGAELSSVRTGRRRVRRGPGAERQLGRGDQQQSMDPAPVPRPQCRGPGGRRGPGQAGGPLRAPARLLRHPGLDPGGDEPHPGRRGVLRRGAPPRVRTPDPQLSHGPPAFGRPKPLFGGRALS